MAPTVFLAELAVSKLEGPATLLEFRGFSALFFKNNVLVRG